MRETTKEIKLEVDGKEMTFQIRKMDALHGTYLLKFCAEKILPVYNGLQDIFTGDKLPENASEEDANRVARERTEKVISMIPEALSKLSEEELMLFEVRCLQTVDCLKPAGWQPVMIGKEFGIEEIEYDAIATLRLVFEVLSFNLGSFFGGKALASFLSSQASSPQNA